jgi:hypothetical protein
MWTASSGASLLREAVDLEFEDAAVGVARRGPRWGVPRVRARGGAQLVGGRIEGSWPPSLGIGGAHAIRGYRSLFTVRTRRVTVPW